MNETPDVWKKNDSKQVADCRVFKVREDFCKRETDEKEASFFVIESPDWANIIAVTKNGEVVMIEQFRHGIKKVILEVPGGMIDDGEETETAAKRELLEETGFSSDKFVLLGKSYPNPAIQNNTIYHFLALDCEKTDETSFDEHESVLTKLVPFDEVQKLIENGEISHSLVVAAFYYLSIYENKNKNVK